ncbi:MAG: DNA-packaging protein [Lachnospiraceae bacterium]|nr:DNA-packaging protein [Lachnospiraceae bacterium]
MLAKVKLAKRISTTVFDSELLDLIAAAIADLKLIGIEFDVTETKTQGVVTDYTITDPLISRAITTYVVMNFGSPDDYDRLKESYDEQKGQLRETSGYGLEVL